MAFSIGVSENMINSYKNVRNFWHTNYLIKKNVVIEKLLNVKNDDTEECNIF